MNDVSLTFYLCDSAPVQAQSTEQASHFSTGWLFVQAYKLTQTSFKAQAIMFYLLHQISAEAVSEAHIQTPTCDSMCTPLSLPPKSMWCAWL